jgi:hypothetical protein
MGVLDLLSASILIVPAYPLHREFEAVLIAAFRRNVEVMVGTIIGPSNW